MMLGTKTQDRGVVVMNEKGRACAHQMRLIRDKKTTRVQSALELGFSYRHTCRLYTRWLLFGDEILVNARRGQSGNRSRVQCREGFLL